MNGQIIGNKPPVLITPITRPPTVPIQTIDYDTGKAQYISVQGSGSNFTLNNVGSAVRDLIYFLTH